MKKRTILIIVIIVVLIVLAVIGGMFLIGRSIKNHSSILGNSDVSSVNSGNSRIEIISNGYAWVNDRYDNYTLIDTNGKIIFELPKEYKPNPVHEGFFVANLKSTYDNLPITKIMDVNGNTVFDSIISYNDEYEEETFSNFGRLLGDSNSEWAVETRKDIKSINGVTEEYKYYALKDGEVIDYTDREGNLKEYKFDVRDDDTLRSNFVISDTETSRSRYVLNRNGFFTVIHNEEQQFEPVEGVAEAIDGNDDSYRFIALVDGKHYVYNEDGSRQEIPNIDSSYTVQCFAGDVAAVAKNNSIGAPELSNILINVNTGEQIQIHN